MLYLIYAQDVPNSLENRLSVRPAHLARLQALRDAPRWRTHKPGLNKIPTSPLAFMVT